MKFKDLYEKGLDRKVNPAVSASFQVYCEPVQVKYCLKTLKMYIISSYSFNLATKIRIIFRISNKNVTFAV